MIARSDICGVVVTYHPAEGIAKTLRAISDQVGKLLIIDNGSAPECIRALELLARPAGWELKALGRNLGIGAALNVGLQAARSSGYRWLATFDQDSEPTPSMLERMASALQHHPLPDQLAVVAPVHADRRADLILRQFGADDSEGVGWRELVTTMTSGNLVDVGKATEAGGWRESFFIDYVDHEFCLRLRRAGWRIIEATPATLMHSLGRLQVHRMGPLRIAHTNHAPNRRYYMTRNRSILWRDYWRTERSWVIGDIRAFVVDFAAIAMLERHAVAKLVMVLRGLVDGARRIAGPLKGQI